MRLLHERDRESNLLFFGVCCDRVIFLETHGNTSIEILLQLVGFFLICIFFICSSPVDGGTNEQQQTKIAHHDYFAFIIRHLIRNGNEKYSPPAHAVPPKGIEEKNLKSFCEKAVA